MMKPATHVMRDANLARQCCLQKKQRRKLYKNLVRTRNSFLLLSKPCILGPLQTSLLLVPWTQQRWHRVVLEKNNLHVSRFIILASSRGCPRSVDNNDHEREQVQNTVTKGSGTFSPWWEKSKTKINAPPDTKKSWDDSIPAFIQYVIWYRN